MNIRNKIMRKNKKGSVIAYILVIMAIVSVILTSSIQFIASRIKYGYTVESKEQAFQIAESGIYFFRWYLAHNTDGRTAQQIKNFWDNRTELEAETVGTEYKDPGGSPIGKYQLQIDPPESGSTILTVTSSGWTYKNPQNVRTIKVRFRRPSWSEFMVLSDAMNRFGDGTHVYGKIFSNSGIHFDGVAHNIVQSAVDEYYDRDHDVRATKPGVWTSWPNEYNSNMGSDVFLAGKMMEVPSKDFSGVTADLSLMKSIAQAGTDGSLYFDDSGQGRHIVLNADGTFDICTVKNIHGDKKYIKECGAWSTYPIPDNGVIFVEKNVWIEGTINDKRLTIVAANMKSATRYNVYIEHDITYTNYDGRDVLGIIAEDDIEVPYYSENNLRIDAALMAQEGRAGCEDYGNSKDTITIYGSIASKERYGFAWVGGGGYHSGYDNRNLVFDNNLLYNPPPYFPTGTQYLMDLWEEL